MPSDETVPVTGHQDVTASGSSVPAGAAQLFVAKIETRMNAMATLTDSRKQFLGLYDGTVADNIVQFGMFGKSIYG